MRVFYRCEVCFQRFRSEANCTAHELLEHADQPQPAEEEPSEVNYAEISDGEEGEITNILDRPVFEIDEDQVEELRKAGNIVMYSEEYERMCREAQQKAEKRQERQQQPEQFFEPQAEDQAPHQESQMLENQKNMEPEQEFVDDGYVETAIRSHSEPLQEQLEEQHPEGIQGTQQQMLEQSNTESDSDSEREPEPEYRVFEVTPEEAVVLRQAGNHVFEEIDEPQQELLDEESPESHAEHLQEQLEEVPLNNQLESRQQEPAQPQHIERLHKARRTRHGKAPEESRRKVPTKLKQQERAEAFSYRQENDEPVQQNIQESETRGNEELDSGYPFNSTGGLATAEDILRFMANRLTNVDLNTGRVQLEIPQFILEHIRSRYSDM